MARESLPESLTAEEVAIAAGFLNRMTNAMYQGNLHMVLANIVPDGRIWVTVGKLDENGMELQFLCRADGTNFQVTKGTDEDIRDFLSNCEITGFTDGAPIQFG